MRFNPDCGCCGPTACLIHEEALYDGDDWTVGAGTWTLGPQTTSNNARYYANPPVASSPLKFEWSLQQGDALVAGFMLAYLDADNYIYIRVTCYDTNLTVDGEIEVFHVDGGVETSMQPATTYNGLGLMEFTVCVSPSTGGYLPVVQIEVIDTGGPTSGYLHVCVTDLPGTGYGYRTDDLHGNTAYFGGGGGVAPLITSNNYRADTGNAGRLPGGRYSCECVYQCAHCAESAQVPELTVDINLAVTGGRGCQFATLCGDESFVVEGYGHLDGTSNPVILGNLSTFASYLGITFSDYTSGWSYGGTPSFGTLVPNLNVMLAKSGSDYWLLVDSNCTSGVKKPYVMGYKNLGSTKPNMMTLNETITESGMIPRGDAADNLDYICDVLTGGTIDIAGVAVSGCP